MHASGKHSLVLKIHLAVIAHVVVAIVIIHALGFGPHIRNLVPALHGAAESSQ